MIRGVCRCLAEHGALGRERMASASVAVCGIVRDCATALARNIPAIEAVRAQCGHSWVVIVENDSLDGTECVLQHWQKAQPDVHVICADGVGQGAAPVPQPGPPSPYSRHRIERMAAVRNLYLEYVETQLPQAEYILVVDLDVERVDLAGIADTFGQPTPWDAITANGRSLAGFRRFWQGYLYYDTYAFRRSEDVSPQTWPAILKNQRELQRLRPGLPLLPVASAFGGLAVYRREALRGCRYIVSDNADAYVQVLCEHVGLHQQMAARGHHRIYVNPAMVVWYETYHGRLGRYMRRLCGGPAAGAAPAA